jgi:acetyl esterase/lipase
MEGLAMTISDAARDYLAKVAPPKAEPAADDIEAWRLHVQRAVEAMEAAAATEVPKVPADVEDVELGGVPAYHAVARHRTLARVILFFHGGALVYGRGRVGRYYAAVEAVRSEAEVYSVDYRTPPDHPFPAAADDCIRAYEALLAMRSPKEIAFVGESAGGNLAAVTIIRARERGLPPPACLVLLSPQVDLTESGCSFSDNQALDPILRGGAMTTSRLYAGSRPLNDPEVSPLFADLRGFPPTHIQSGTHDLMLSNAVRFHRALRRTGAVADLNIWEAAPHGGFGGHAPEDVEMRWEINRFLRTMMR